MNEWYLTRVYLLWHNVSFTHFETWLDYHAGLLDFLNKTLLPLVSLQEVP